MKELFIGLLILLTSSFAHADGMIIGSGTTACSEANNEVGNRSDSGGSDVSRAADYARCQLFTADCTGNLATGYFQHQNTTQAEAKVCLYSYDGDAPDTGDLKIGCADINGGTTTGLKSAAIDGGTVVQGTTYFLCMFVSTTAAWLADVSSVSTSDAWYKTSSGFYATPPANLVGTGWNSLGAVAQQLMYITIGP